MIAPKIAQGEDVVLSFEGVTGAVISTAPPCHCCRRLRLNVVPIRLKADTGASQYTYDANGNVLTKTDARGKQTQYSWDSLNRLKTISYPTGTGSSISCSMGMSMHVSEGCASPVSHLQGLSH
ncbi:RHS repeat domain-containing protein [Polaromonas sp.]|uniref:RHS repeat domain-containing protein n=1 Tax=Polaromonas sp. TaxID=1869339 RepID=UPI00326463CD